MVKIDLVVHFDFNIGLGRKSGRIPDIEIIRLDTYAVSSDIQAYFTEVIQPDIRQFSLLYQTKLTLSNPKLIIFILESSYSTLSAQELFGPVLVFIPHSLGESVRRYPLRIFVLFKISSFIPPPHPG